ncbi:MAG: hypothetical protein K1Y36_28345 [Blastocatellia bacterium]|nr:hypothetical protein [Blastocatellia bacterium]
MRKFGFWLLVCLFVLIPSVSFGQEKPSEELYKKFLNERQAQIATVKPEFVLAASSRRIDAQKAEIEITLNGVMAGYAITVQPLAITKIAGKYAKAGTESKMQAGKAKNDGVMGEISAQPTITFPVEISANAVEIAFSPLGRPSLGPASLILSLSSGTSVGMFAVAPLNRNQVSLNSAQSKLVKSMVPPRFCNCWWIQSYCSSTASWFCKYCANNISNQIDTILCTITCGTTCSNRDCVDLECNGS